ncbi:N-6 DNA methylase [Streptomyces albidoflavus]|uniref:N-6 DNA methylase n=1 Tax=Streptomyces albidoflavus TaxID=1886 RepID=UPI0030867035|nr:N-6 DNA methylase [Streptomyces albidoflavus]
MDLVASFGLDSKLKLNGPGDREAAIRTPLENLLSGVGKSLGVAAVFHDEVRDEERRVRPDYGVKVNGAIAGYIEVKAPGKSVDPEFFTGHDERQWNRQKDLPNLVYTNGTEWRLYRNAELIGEPVRLDGGSLAQAGRNLRAPASFETLLRDFMLWKPAPITTVSALVQAVAPLTRLLRGEVLDQLEIENRNVALGANEEDQPFIGLSRDWRRLLFPSASDEIFADGYAQTVTFALLLAKTERLELAGASLHEIGDGLGSHHSLMGRALQLLTESVIGDFKVTLDLLVRVIDAVEWEAVRSGRKDTYLHLYENFLALYDPQLRKKSGSYYTPREVVEQMTRLAEDAVITELGKSQGFLEPDVLIVDPAMGTGTYLHHILERCAERAQSANGPGLVAGTVGDVAQRIIGFELQMGPYAVAELRTTDLLRKYGANPPTVGMRTYVTNTLDDPNADVTQLASGLRTISASRRRANEVKARTPVTVVIGNPPYRENAGGEGGWVEVGDPSNGIAPPLNDFRIAGDGVYVQNIKNLYVYFWRWAMWKVFDAHPKACPVTDGTRAVGQDWILGPALR